MTARIVVGVDGSEHSGRALAFALQEARIRGATVDAVLAYPYVADYPGMEFGASPPPRQALEAEATSTLRRALDRMPSDVTVEPIVVEGPAAGALIETAREADLLVVGSRGRGGFTGLLLGSTSHQVVGHASCPVVVVPTPARDASSTAAA